MILSLWIEFICFFAISWTITRYVIHLRGIWFLYSEEKSYEVEIVVFYLKHFDFVMILRGWLIFYIVEVFCLVLHPFWCALHAISIKITNIRNGDVAMSSLSICDRGEFVFKIDHFILNDGVFIKEKILPIAQISQPNLLKLNTQGFKPSFDEKMIKDLRFESNLGQKRI